MRDVVRRVSTRDDPVQTLLNPSRDAPLVVVDGGRHGTVVAETVSRVSPAIVARRNPFTCVPLKSIGGHRKIHGTGQFQ